MKRLLVAALITAGILVAIFSLFMVTGGAQWIEGHLMTEEGAHFKVPANALPLQQVELKASPEVITICNRSAERWSNLLIQVSSVGSIYEASAPPHAPSYLAELQSLDSGKCKEISIENFTESSPKRLRAYRGMQITKVEVLADVPRRAYAAQQVSPN